MTMPASKTSFNATSLWQATAGDPPVADTLPRESDTRVLIIGAGYTGLSTALHLAELNVPVTVVEQHSIGYGASGRNGGQVNPGIKLDPPEILRQYGQQKGEALISFSGKAPDTLFDLARRHQIDCNPAQNGWLLTAQRDRQLRALEDKAAAWQVYGVPMRMLDAQETAAITGSSIYTGALLDPRGGSVHPLNLTLGLARAAQRHGATLHTGTPVTRLTRSNGQWIAHVQGQTLRADHVVIATNGYTGNLTPELRKTVVAANSYQVCTEELSDDILAGILPGLQTVTDSRRIIIYYRKYGKRIVLGGRGHFRDPFKTADFSHLKQTLHSIFPQLRGVNFSHHWAGRVAMTMDGLPHIHEPEPGLLMALGYNGRGVALATALGGAIARYIESGDPDVLPFPKVPIQTIPFHGLQRIYVSSAVAAYRLLDKM